MRDDFNADTIRKLGERVGLHCSKCRVATKGPHTNDAKATSIGIAAHIHAASSEGFLGSPTKG